MSLFLFSHTVTTSYWLVVPFALLLLLIATGPVLFPRLWHEAYKNITVALGSMVALWYIIGFDQPHLVVESLAEYISFISLLLALYIASGGIYIFADYESKPSTNLAFLLIGAVLTNVVGTTGASILLIRPFMRLNRYRLKPYHIVFFIFFVSNIGGALTPIGDPPLFLGFLRGIPFFWTITHVFWIWLITLMALGAIFYWIDRRNTQLDDVDISAHYTKEIIINGKRNFIWLALIVGTVFLDPNIFEGFPHIVYHGKKISFIRELLQLSIGLTCMLTANKKAMQSNDFDFEPIKEVGFLFYGIFLTMIPALQILESIGSHGTHLSIGQAYWYTGLASSILDNAPAFINFVTLTLSSFGFSITDVNQVRTFVAGEQFTYIVSISIASVFFGAMTYIGNGPNFMVKSIAEKNGVKMPSFFRYITHFSIPFLLPLLALIWLLFFI